MSESLLIEKYKKLLGIDNIITTADDTVIIGNVTITADLFITNNSVIGNNLYVSSSSIIDGNTIVNGNVTISNNLNVSLNTVIQNNITNTNNLVVDNDTIILNNLYVSNNTIIDNNITVLNDLNVNDTIRANTAISVDNIYSNTDLINIDSDIINIGNENSVINLNGTTINILTTEISITDKLIALNYEETTGKGRDIGNNSGLVFYNDVNSGYIKTNSTADRFVVLPPGGFTENYIATIDMLDNLVISGNSNFNGNVTINNILNVNETAVFNNDITVNNDLHVSDTMLVGNNITIGTNLFVTSASNINNNVNVGNNVYISDTLLVDNNATVQSKLNVSGLAIIYGDVTVLSNINANADVVCTNDVTIFSSMKCNNDVINNNNLTVGNTINVINDALLYNVSIGNTLYVSNNTFIENNVTINSSLHVSGNSYIDGSVTFGNISSITTILGNINTSLAEYDSNQSAIDAGLPLWALYRTGGIIKVVLHEIPPVISFSGLNSDLPNVLSPGETLIFSDVLNIESHQDYPITTIDTPSYVYYEYPGGSTTTATSLDSSLVGEHNITYNIYDYFKNLGIQTLSVTISNGYYPFVVDLDIPGTTYTNNNYVHDGTLGTAGSIYHITYDAGFNNSNIIPTYILGDANDPKIYKITYEQRDSESIKSIRTVAQADAIMLSKNFLNSVGYNIQNSFTFMYKMKSKNVTYAKINFPVIPLNYYFNDDDPTITTQPRYTGNYYFGGGHRNSHTYEEMSSFFKFVITRDQVIIYKIPNALPTEVNDMYNNITYTFNIYHGNETFTTTGQKNNLVATDLGNSIPEIRSNVYIIQNLVNFNDGWFLKIHYNAIELKFYIVVYDNNGTKKLETIVNNVNLADLMSYRATPSEVEYIIPHDIHNNQNENKFYEGVVYKSSDILLDIPSFFPEGSNFS